MAIGTDTLNKLIAAPVAAMGLELWGCEFLPSGHSSILRVYVEGENGVSIDECAKVSRQISAVLDVEDVIPGKYRLEVSSPGMDRLLFTKEHFVKMQGATIKVKLSLPVAEQRNFTGLLKAVVNEDIILDVDGEDLQLALGMIQKARVVLDA